MTRPVPQDRRRPGTATPPPQRVDFREELARLRFALPPVDPRKLRRRTGRKGR